MAMYKIEDQFHSVQLFFSLCFCWRTMRLPCTVGTNMVDSLNVFCLYILMLMLMLTYFCSWVYTSWVWSQVCSLNIYLSPRHSFYFVLFSGFDGEFWCVTIDDVLKCISWYLVSYVFCPLSCFMCLFSRLYSGFWDVNLQQHQFASVRDVGDPDFLFARTRRFRRSAAAPQPRVSYCWAPKPFSLATTPANLWFFPATGRRNGNVIVVRAHDRR